MARALNLQRCPTCAAGGVPQLLDRDGVKTSISGKNGLWQHAQGDCFWPCSEYHYTNRLIADIFPELAPLMFEEDGGAARRA